MDALIDTPSTLAPDSTPLIALSTVSPQFLDDPDNVKAKVPPPLFHNLFDNVKVEVAPEVENPSLCQCQRRDSSTSS